MNLWGTVADWFVVLGTLILAATAVFQETIRGWFYHPRFQVSIKTEPPDCVAVPVTLTDGTFVADSVYLRLWVENIGNATAKNAEVYAKELRRKRADDTWERIDVFPPMNLKWANIGIIYFPNIPPGMGKHCDVGHIVDPARRDRLRENAPRLALINQQTSLAFDLMVAPNHRGHIIGPGEYQLDILVAAENARPIKETIAIDLPGAWYADEAIMLRDGVGVTIV
ncbi:MAG: hypothetical protein HY211_05350 [Candidatus Omnitrophica bacterium]|nr:hypothetical protein [Candidatus Omnitrophota bacterium]